MSIRNRARALTAATLAAGLLGVGAVANAADLPVQNIDPAKQGSLTIHKYSGAPVPERPYPLYLSRASAPGEALSEQDLAKLKDYGNLPLEGVEFTLYKVTGLDVTNPLDWPKITDLNEAVVDAGKGAKAMIDSTAGLETVLQGTPQTTGADGIAKWTPLDLGVYLVEETGAPAHVAEHTLPFLVTVPLAKNSDGSWIYDVNVYPKNATVDIHKENVDPGNVGIGSLVTWSIDADIPADAQRDLDSFVIMDTLDPRLAYEDKTLVATIQTAGTPLAVDTDYTLTYGTVNGVDNVLRIVFTPAGLTKLDGAAKGSRVHLEFKTRVTSLGTNGIIENDAEIFVNNPSDSNSLVPGTGFPSNRVKSKWGAIDIYKYGDQGTSPKTNPLQGAVFQVFGTKDQADTCLAAVKASGFNPSTGCDNAIWSYAQDMPAALLPSGATSTKFFTTGQDGKVTIPGLNVGVEGTKLDGTEYNTGDSRDYYLVEIKAPAGFILSDAVHEVTVVPSGTAQASVVFELPNKQEPPTTMPNTGATAMVLLSVGAGALILGAAVIAVASKRKSNQDA